ncbi:MAG: TetR/AcrR family transcriptional regulator [Pseudomonadales bacterium]|nr:TetR/AcrR family transcriptional regulator [Pseudomonadales bacterium]
MGRTKAFNPEQVLNQALMLFWQQGYQATSVADLEKHLGINKFSLYNTFGNKHSLYLQALDLYIEQRFTPLFSMLANHQMGLEAISHFFNALNLGLSNQLNNEGCFVASAGVELSASDNEVRKRVQGVYGQLEDGFYACLESAQQQGKLEATLSLQELARFFLVQSQGMLTVARNQQSARTVTSSTEFLNTLLLLLKTK